MVARITGEAKQLEAAEDLAQAVLALPALFPWHSIVARAALGLVAVQRGDISAAQEQYAALKALPAILVHYITRDRVLGLLAEAMGQLDQAIAHFKDALAFCEKAGYRPEWAWTAYECARCLHEKNTPSDNSRATSLLEQTLTIISELAMGPLRDRVLMVQRQIESRLNHAREYPDGLTEREVAVLRLVTLGKSNSEIGHELVLSVRTVERHITNIYAKIHVRGRADATAYAFTRGLVS